jgi:c-di-GMP-binding flagellar brake protein YcgR
MTIDEDDPYVVSQPLEIQAILNGLLTRRILVRLDVPRRETSIISTLLDIDKKAGTIVLDNSSDDTINTRFLQAPMARLQGMLDQVMIEFTGRLTPARHGGRPAFAMLQPQQLRRMQRREYFRIDIPATSTSTCLIESSTLPSEQTLFRMIDLSAGGVRLADPDGLLKDTARGTIFDECTLNLSETVSVDVSLRLLRHTQLLQENGKLLDTVACRFFNLPANRQITIQQYIGTLERAAMARRWGME